MSWDFALYAIDTGSKEESMEDLTTPFLRSLTLATEYRMEGLKATDCALCWDVTSLVEQTSTCPASGNENDMGVYGWNQPLDHQWNVVGKIGMNKKREKSKEKEHIDTVYAIQSQR